MFLNVFCAGRQAKLQLSLLHSRLLRVPMISSAIGVLITCKRRLLRVSTISNRILSKDNLLSQYYTDEWRLVFDLIYFVSFDLEEDCASSAAYRILMESCVPSAIFI